MLKTWVAQRLENFLNQGRTKPLVVNCVLADPADTEPGENSQEAFVLKAEGLPEITQAHLFNEIVGNLVARRFGMNTPEPGIILLTEEFVKATEQQLGSRGLRIKVGNGAGAAYMTGMANVLLGAPPTSDELDQMTRIYAFDMLVQNPDRRPENPNCASLNGNLVSFDFDMCFSFVWSFGTDDPVAITKHGLAASHCFRRTLAERRASISWKPALTALASLSDGELMKIISTVPTEWQEFAERIRSHMSSIRQRTTSLEIELHRSLS